MYVVSHLTISLDNFFVKWPLARTPLDNPFVFGGRSSSENNITDHFAKIEDTANVIRRNLNHDGLGLQSGFVPLLFLHTRVQQTA